MTGIHFLIISVGLFGMLPLAIILFKRNRVKKILQTGMLAKARIYRVTSTPKMGDSVSYTFYNETRHQYYGSLHCKPGLYKQDDVIDIYYLKSNPNKNTLQGAWKSPAILWFGIAIAAFVWFAVYKLFEMVKSGAI